MPGGVFDRGSTTGDPDEQPVHSVEVPAFEITQSEITVGHYSECVAAGACTAPRTGATANWNASGYQDHPVNFTSWRQAAEFCAWSRARLPTEAEWEYAARALGQTTAYPWGEEPATCDDAVFNDGGAGCGTNRTSRVCSKEPGHTAQGLCDMAGNVMEWVQDLYHANYEGAPSDGSAWRVDGTLHVARGGGFESPAEDLRASARIGYHEAVQMANVGFRCARSAR